jgi:hypothetical protein
MISETGARVADATFTSVALGKKKKYAAAPITIATSAAMALLTSILIAQLPRIAT